MVGLGTYNHFEAQLPMALEAIVASNVEEHYNFELGNNGSERLQIDLRRMIKQIIADIREGKARSFISSKFHNCLAAGLLEMAKEARASKKLDTVALSGGVFCNRYLTNRLVKLLRKNDFNVLFNREVPSNDGGIALGQAAIASYLVSRGS
ncbi:hypothetical protein ES703_35910 [subsurface metagenome]